MRPSQPARRPHGRLLPILFACCIALLAFRLAPSAWAADPAGGEEPPTSLEVKTRAVLRHSHLPPGGESVLAVTYVLPANSHLQVGDFLYAVPVDGEPYQLSSVLSPKPATFEGEPVHQGEPTFYYRLRLDPKVPLGARDLKLTISWQACIEQPVFACFAPEEATVTIPVEVVASGLVERDGTAQIFASLPGELPPVGGGTSSAGADGSTESAGGVPPAATTGGLAGKLEAALAKNLFLALVLVFLGGVASSFTPCVYPIIPITISYIGGRSKGKLGGFFLSLFFVLGIAIMYSVLGVVAATSGALFGSAMQSTPVLLVVAAVFLIMGISMLGAFDLALPSGLQTRLQGGPRTGVLGAVFMGMVTGLIASPCVGPVVVVLLTYIAKVGGVGYGFALMFTYALGLGLLFLVIGTFAGALNALPAAGQWMETVKQVFGVILIGMAIFYLRPLIGDAITWLATGVLVVLVGTFLGAFRPVPEDPEPPLLLRKGFGIVLLLSGSFALLFGLSTLAGLTGVSRLETVGAGTTALASNGGGNSPAHPGPSWVHDDGSGWDQARREGRPVVMDFYADWCGACVELDEKTWIDPRVRDEAQRFVAIKMDFTDKSERSEAKQAEYRVLGLPTVIFFDGAGNEVERFFGFRPAESVLASMQRIP